MILWFNVSRINDDYDGVADVDDVICDSVAGYCDSSSATCDVSTTGEAICVCQTGFVNIPQNARACQSKLLLTHILKK